MFWSVYSNNQIELQCVYFKKKSPQSNFDFFVSVFFACSESLTLSPLLSTLDRRFDIINPVLVQTYCKTENKSSFCSLPHFFRLKLEIWEYWTQVKGAFLGGPKRSVRSATRMGFDIFVESQPLSKPPPSKFLTS